MAEASAASWRRTGPWGVIEIPRASPLPPGASPADARRLQAVLNQPDLLGVVVALRCGKAAPDAPAGISGAVGRAGVPSVAAVSGVCRGWMLDTAFSCLFRTAGRSSSFLLHAPGPELAARIALTLPRRAAGLARESGRRLAAEEAFEAGAVDSLAEEGAETSAAIELLERLVSHVKPRVVRSVMESLDAPRRLSRGEAMRLSARMFCSLATGMAADD